MIANRLRLSFCRALHSRLIPVYKRDFVPDPVLPMRLYIPALAVLGFNIYNELWEPKNLAVLALAAGVTAFAALGTKTRNGATITQIDMEEDGQKLHIKIFDPRNNLREIHKVYGDSKYNPETHTLVIPTTRIQLNQNQISPKIAERHKQELILKVLMQRLTPNPNLTLPFNSYLTIDLKANLIEDTTGYLQLISRPADVDTGAKIVTEEHPETNKQASRKVEGEENKGTEKREQDKDDVNKNK